MRTTLASLLCLLSALSAAQETDLRGIPAEASVVGEFRNNAELSLSKHPAMANLRDRLLSESRTAAKQKDVEKILRAELGLDLEKDIRSATFGLVLGKPTTPPQPEGEPRVSIVIRGSFDTAKFEAFAAKHKLPPVVSGSRKGWNASAFAAALTGEKQGPDGQAVLFMHDANTLLITQGKDAANCLEALAGKRSSYALPTAAKSVIPASGKPYGFVYADIAAMPPTPELEKSGLRNATLSLSEQGSRQSYRLKAVFADADKAKAAATQLQAFIAMAPLLAMSNPKDSAVDARLKKIAVKILGGFDRPKAEAERVTLGLGIENEDVVEFLECVYGLSLTTTAKPAQKKGG